MNVIKLTTNGQVTIPKFFRDKFKTVQYYTCEVNEGGVLFKPLDNDGVIKKRSTKYDITDLRKFRFKGRNPKEKNLSSKIDSIVYKI